MHSPPRPCEPAQDTRRVRVPLDAPPWLHDTLAPWRITSAAIVHEGLALALDTGAVHVTVVVGRSGVVASHPAADTRAGRAVAAAVGARLRRRGPEAAAWWARVLPLHAALTHDATITLPEPLDAVFAMLESWPASEAALEGKLAPLPEDVADRAAAAGGAVPAALVLHHFARGDVLGGLEAWQRLGAMEDRRGWLDAVVDAIALAILGRAREARSALDAASARASDADAWLVVARGLETMGDRPAAVCAYERVVALRGDPWDRLRLARAGGGSWVPTGCPTLPPDIAPEHRLEFARALARVLEDEGRFDDALAVLDGAVEGRAPPAPTGDGAAPRDARAGRQTAAELALRSAELRLYRGEVEAALARAAFAETWDLGECERRRARVVRGAAAVLAGRFEEALEILEDSKNAENACGCELERFLWLAEAHLALGAPDRALAWVDRHLARRNSLAAYLLKLLAVLRNDATDPRTWNDDEQTFLDELVRDVLPDLRPPARMQRAMADRGAMAELVRGILDDLAGCRAPRLIRCVRDPRGGRRLERLRVRPTGREAAVANLVRIREEPPEAVLAGFDAVAAEYPRSPHPHTYRGELLLWLGRYRDALTCFDEADARAPTRWSSIGRAAAHELLGEPEKADEWIARGTSYWGETPAATTHVYRGERHRRRGAWDDARRDLEIALRSKPRRLGARINLALVCLATGDESGFAAHAERLCADAPAFLWEAGARPGRPLDEATLLTALDLMSGNRSSFLHTLIDREGHFRVIPDPALWTVYARQSLDAARAEIGRTLAAGWLGSLGGARARDVRR